jgi:DNA-binding protein YbaB
LLRCPSLKLSSNAGESEGDFRARIAQSLREKRDAEIDKLRAKYAPRITTLTDQVRRAQERIAREQSQLSQQKVNAAISIGSALLGAFLGRKAVSASSVGRVGTAARSAGRVSQESGDVARAGENADVLQQRLADLQAELENETARLQGELDPAAVSIETTSIKPRKSETTATALSVVWVPV